MQQVLAFESDILEYGDIFDGSHVVEARTAELRDAAQAELDDVLGLGGAFEAVDVLKTRLVTSMAERTRRIESGEQVVVGVNDFVETAASPLGGDRRRSCGSIRRSRPRPSPPSPRGAPSATTSPSRPRSTSSVAWRESGDNVMPASIALAKAGGTTGEWGALMREVFGEYRAPTGVGSAQAGRGELAAVAEFVRTIAGGPPKLLVAKPGLDGHSNGAEQIAVAARDAGMEVVYAGIRLTPEQIAASARDEDPDVIGISILSGSHLELVPEVIERCRAEGVDAAIVVGGIIPEDDRARLLEAGVAAVYTPKDFRLADIMRDIAELTAARRAPRLIARASGVACVARGSRSRPGTSWPTISRSTATASSSRPRSMPVAMPSSSSRWTRSSVGRLPPAPLANGEPPSPPAEVSNRLTPQRIAS